MIAMHVLYVQGFTKVGINSSSGSLMETFHSFLLCMPWNACINLLVVVHDQSQDGHSSMHQVIWYTLHSHKFPTTLHHYDMMYWTNFQTFSKSVGLIWNFYWSKLVKWDYTPIPHHPLWLRHPIAMCRFPNFRQQLMTGQGNEGLFSWEVQLIQPSHYIYKRVGDEWCGYSQGLWYLQL